MSLDLPSGVFATSRSRVDLVYGMPARMEVDQGNELVGITAIPLTVINSFFRAVGEVFQLRINYDSRYTQVLESDLQRQRVQDRYDAEQRRRDEEQNNRGADATLAPPDAAASEVDGSASFGDAPETTAKYLEEDQGATEDQFTAEQKLAVTIVPGPSPLLFYVPLQPKSEALPSDDLEGPPSSGATGDQPG